MQRAAYTNAPGIVNDGLNLSTTTSYTWPVPVWDYAASLSVMRETAANPAQWWAAAGTIKFTFGNGASGTPTNQPGNTTGLALPPDGGALYLGYSGGNYTIRVLTFDVSATVTATVSGSTLTCATACTNMFYQNATIEIPGAGGGAGLYTGTMTAISADGKTVTLSPAVSTTFSGVSKTLRMYSEQIPTTDTGVAATCNVVTTFCESSFSFQLHGSEAVIYNRQCFMCRQIWRGNVIRFGGNFRPVISFSGSILTWYLNTDANSSSPVQADGRPENGTPFRQLTNDVEMWGPYPGYSGRWGGANIAHMGPNEQTMIDKIFGDLSLNVGTNGRPIATNTPTTGFTYTIPQGQEWTYLTPAGTLATGTVTLPTGIAPGQIVQLTSSQIITSLTVSAPSGSTIAGTAVTAMAANGTVAWRMSASGTQFVRVQ